MSGVREGGESLIANALSLSELRRKQAALRGQREHSSSSLLPSLPLVRVGTSCASSSANSSSSSRHTWCTRRPRSGSGEGEEREEMQHYSTLFAREPISQLESGTGVRSLPDGTFTHDVRFITNGKMCRCRRGQQIAWPFDIGIHCPQRKGMPVQQATKR